MSAQASSRKPKSIVIVKTGEPVPSVAERRGQFAELIRDAIGGAWDGGYQIVDVRTEARGGELALTGDGEIEPRRAGIA